MGNEDSLICPTCGKVISRTEESWLKRIGLRYGVWECYCEMEKRGEVR